MLQYYLLDTMYDIVLTVIVYNYEEEKSFPLKRLCLISPRVVRVQFIFYFPFRNQDKVGLNETSKNKTL